MKNIEIEARFLNIDVTHTKQEISRCGGADQGEKLLEESIFYDKALTWRDQGKFIRVRSIDSTHTVTYKHIEHASINGATEIEFTITAPEEFRAFLEEIGFVMFRTQQKRRHSFTLDDVRFDFDEWPGIPAYLEIEGPAEDSVRSAAERIGLSWNQATFIDARKIIESYGLDVSKLTYFTFSRCE